MAHMIPPYLPISNGAVTEDSQEQKRLFVIRDGELLARNTPHWPRPSTKKALDATAQV